MKRYEATIFWNRGKETFTDNKYSRKHSWHFDGGLEVPASASPYEVSPPYADPSVIDPEEAFVASISSCHMLWFLSLAATQGFLVDDYKDEATGFMKKNEQGLEAITHVTLRPAVSFAPQKVPNQQKFDKLHKQAHNKCFIAHSVKTEISIEASFNIHK